MQNVLVRYNIYQNSPSGVSLRLSRSRSCWWTSSHSGASRPLQLPKYSPLVPRGVLSLTRLTCSPL